MSFGRNYMNRMTKFKKLHEQVEEYNSQRKESKRRFNLITKEVEDSYYNLFGTTLEGDIENRERCNEQRRNKRV